MKDVDYDIFQNLALSIWNYNYFIIHIFMNYIYYSQLLITIYDYKGYLSILINLCIVFQLHLEQFIIP